jgi:hypothetical protein
MMGNWGGTTMSSGIFFRVKREKWENLELEELSETEIKEALGRFDKDELIKTICRLAFCLWAVEGKI